MDRLRIGSRGSPLARVQLERAIRELHKHHPDIRCEEVIVRTAADRFTGKRLADIGGKGMFVQDIEKALIEGKIDCAVHAIKDMPSRLEEDFILATVLERGSCLDVLVGSHLHSLDDVRGKLMGTSAPRRVAQLRHGYSDVRVVPLRGNVETRLRKMDQGEVDGLILAQAGLNRLGLEDRVGCVLDPHVFLPAASQGAIGIECRRRHGDLCRLLGSLDHRQSRQEVEAERAMLRALDADCHAPVGAYSQWQDDLFILSGMVASTDGQHYQRATRRGTDVQAVGKELGEFLKSKAIL